MNKLFKIIVFSLIGLLLVFTSCSNKKHDDGNDGGDKGNPPVIKTEYSVIYSITEGAFEDGSTLIEEKYVEGTTVNITKQVPVREGYDFVGWKNMDTGEIINSSFVINSDMFFVETWVLESYQVTLKAGVGKFANGENELVYSVEQNSKFMYSDLPVHSDRTFSGWFDSNGNYFVQGTEISGDITLTAKYRTPGSEYNLKYVLNGGTQSEPIETTYFEGINYHLPIPTKEGFEFVGWYQTSDFSGEQALYHHDENEGDITYYAQWNITSLEYAEVIVKEMVPEEITENINLATTYQGAKIRWTTSDPMLVTMVGKIFPTHMDESITLTAKVTLDNNTVEIERVVTVKAIEFDDLVNPVAGYFYATGINNPTEAMIENLDIIYYAFAHVTESGAVVLQSTSAFNELWTQGNELRQSGTRIVLSIAGGASAFSAACKSKGVVYVAQNIVSIVDQYHLDGVDIDWEFPSDNTDMQNLTNLCKAVRNQLDKKTGEGCDPYLVTAAIPSHESYLKFDFKGLNQYLDYVNMMSYDMNLAGQGTHLCPTYSDNKDGNKKYGCDDGINKFTSAGLDKEKIIIGAAFYGKAYKITGENRWDKYPGLGSMAELVALQYNSGTVTYSYIYKNILTDKGFTRYYDPDACVPFLYNESTKIWITYEDEESLIEKVNFAYQEGVGIMFWEYGYDYENILTDTICREMGKLRGNN